MMKFSHESKQWNQSKFAMHDAHHTHHKLNQLAGGTGSEALTQNTRFIKLSLGKK